jgi:hypothetical protein
MEPDIRCDWRGLLQRVWWRLTVISSLPQAKYSGP